MDMTFHQPTDIPTSTKTNRIRNQSTSMIRDPETKTSPDGSLNVCVISSTYPRHEADYAVPWLRESIKHLTARGHKVTVLVPTYRGLKHHEIDGVPVRRFRYAFKCMEILTHEQGAPNRIRNPFFQLLGAPYVAMGSLKAAKLAWKNQFDVIHSHWPFPHGAIASVARAVGKAPVVTNCHGVEFALAKRKRWVRPLLRGALRSSDRIICNSSHTAEQVFSLSHRTADVIPYGTTVAARPTPLLNHDVSRILFTGRLIQRKGVEYLIRAMTEILPGRKAILEITGDGDQRASLEALTRSLGLEHVVKFYGFVDNATLDRLYSQCDLYVNPSVVDDRGDTEGLGVGPIEAFCHGRPVVACDVGGIPDVVKHRRTGLLVPEKNPMALANAIVELLGDPSYARQLAENGLEFSRTYFNWERITDAIERVYREAIAEFHPSRAMASHESKPREGHHGHAAFHPSRARTSHETKSREGYLSHAATIE